MEWLVRIFFAGKVETFLGPGKEKARCCHYHHNSHCHYRSSLTLAFGDCLCVTTLPGSEEGNAALCSSPIPNSTINGPALAPQRLLFALAVSGPAPAEPGRLRALGDTERSLTA